MKDEDNNFDPKINNLNVDQENVSQLTDNGKKNFVINKKIALAIGAAALVLVVATSAIVSSIVSNKGSDGISEPTSISSSSEDNSNSEISYEMSEQAYNNLLDERNVPAGFDLIIPTLDEEHPVYTYADDKESALAITQIMVVNDVIDPVNGEYTYNIYDDEEMFIISGRVNNGDFYQFSFVLDSEINSRYTYDYFHERPIGEGDMVRPVVNILYNNEGSASSIVDTFLAKGVPYSKVTDGTTDYFMIMRSSLYDLEATFNNENGYSSMDFLTTVNGMGTSTYLPKPLDNINSTDVLFTLEDYTTTNPYLSKK